MNRSTEKKIEDRRIITGAGELEESQKNGFSRALRDEDSFTILYELAHRDAPVAIESLQKTFGADPSYLSSILMSLQRLGVVNRRGNRWVAEGWAMAALKSLESALEDLQLEVPETESDMTSVSLESVIESPAVGATYNGLWIASASHVTLLDRQSGIESRTGTVESRTADFSSKKPDRAQNETRSHDYK